MFKFHRKKHIFLCRNKLKTNQWLRANILQERQKKNKMSVICFFGLISLSWIYPLRQIIMSISKITCQTRHFHCILYYHRPYECIHTFKCVYACYFCGDIKRHSTIGFVCSILHLSFVNSISECALKCAEIENARAHTKHLIIKFNRLNCPLKEWKIGECTQ